MPRCGLHASSQHTTPTRCSWTTRLLLWEQACQVRLRHVWSILKFQYLLLLAMVVSP